ncbi:MAG TPA: hypothetical protein DEQ48_05210 [Helicobacter sp.]|nr:hypothetical protein [Helicobacter sp.]
MRFINFKPHPNIIEIVSIARVANNAYAIKRKKGKKEKSVFMGVRGKCMREKILYPPPLAYKY